MVEPHDVGVIVAMREEWREFLRLVPKPQTKGADDDEIFYSFHVPGPHGWRPYHCVAALVGAKGDISASTTTERLRSAFQPKTLVILGISGSLDNKIRHGDVLVATEVHKYISDARYVKSTNPNGFWKELPGPENFRTTWDVVRTCNNLEFSHRQHYRDFVEKCRRRRRALREKFNPRALAKLDRLGLFPDRVTLFAENVHIAAGPAVVAAEEFKNWLKTNRDRNLKAVDEESGGFLYPIWRSVDPMSTLVLRAISDLADMGKTNAEEFSQGTNRSYAMYCCTQLLLTLLRAGLLPRYEAVAASDPLNRRYSVRTNVEIARETGEWFRGTAPLKELVGQSLSDEDRLDFNRPHLVYGPPYVGKTCWALRQAWEWLQREGIASQAWYRDASKDPPEDLSRLASRSAGDPLLFIVDDVHYVYQNRHMP